MTREEQIKEASIAYTKANCPRAIGGDYFRDRVNPFNINHDFIEGAEWADANQPNPWISVEDKLPNDGEIVIVAHRWILGEILYASDVFHIDFGWESYEDVVAWMPIPKLPIESNMLL